MRNVMTDVLLVTLLVGLVGCGGQEGSSVPQREADGPLEGIVEVNGVDLHYLDWGGEGELLLLIPGLGGTAHLWDGIAPHFSDRYRVVALTPREHGASEKPGPPYSIEAFAADFEAAISHFSDGPAIVVGHSFAGAPMIELARRSPSRVAGLVFVDALYDFSATPQPPPILPGFTPATTFPTLADAERYYLDFAPNLVPELLGPYVRSQVIEDGTGQLTWVMSQSTDEQLRGVHAAYAIGDLGGIAIPALAIRAEQAAAIEASLRARGFPPDSIAAGRRWAEEWDDVWKSTAVDQLRDAIPGAQAVVIDSVSHMVPIERPDLIVQILEDFLRSAASGRN